VAKTSSLKIFPGQQNATAPRSQCLLYDCASHCHIVTSTPQDTASIKRTTNYYTTIINNSNCKKPVTCILLHKSDNYLTSQRCLVGNGAWPWGKNVTDVEQKQKSCKHQPIVDVSGLQGGHFSGGLRASGAAKRSIVLNPLICLSQLNFRLANTVLPVTLKFSAHQKIQLRK
jgi:hypothetical protein